MPRKNFLCDFENISVTLDPRGINRRDELNQWRLSFLPILSCLLCIQISHMYHSSCYAFLFIYILAPVIKGMCCKLKCGANIIHHLIFCFLSLLFFSVTLLAVRITGGSGVVLPPLYGLYGNCCLTGYGFWLLCPEHFARVSPRQDL